MTRSLLAFRFRFVDCVGSCSSRLVRGLVNAIVNAILRLTPRFANIPRILALLPAVSLIISSKGRYSEIHKLLASLAQQTMRDMEVIVVDQNDDDRLSSILEGHPFPIRHVRMPQTTGVSCGRNIGLGQASAPLVIFPDDDCWYPSDFLERAVATMDAMCLDALTGRPTDEAGNPIQGRFERSSRYIDKGNVWTTQIEWLSIWRRERLIDLGGFDEAVGVGAKSPWQSAEGQDLMLRLLASGGTAWFDATLVGHDAGVDPKSADAGLRRKARSYGRGMGFVIQKHRLGAVVAANFLIRPIAGALLAFVRGRINLARYYLATFLGRVEGLRRRCIDAIVI